MNHQEEFYFLKNNSEKVFKKKFFDVLDAIQEAENKCDLSNTPITVYKRYEQKDILICIIKYSKYDFLWQFGGRSNYGRKDEIQREPELTDMFNIKDASCVDKKDEKEVIPLLLRDWDRI